MKAVFWRSIRAMWTPARTASVTAFLLLFSVPADAEVVRFVVEQRQAVASQGIPYEKLTGRFYGQLDPRQPLNTIITDIELAPRNDSGMVEYSATFTILKPVDMSTSTGVLVYQVPNRGRQTIEGGGFSADFRAAGNAIVASGGKADIPAAPGSRQWWHRPRRIWTAPASPVRSWRDSSTCLSEPRPCRSSVAA